MDGDQTIIDRLVALDREIREEEALLESLQSKCRALKESIVAGRDRQRGLIRLNDPEMSPLYNQDGELEQQE